MIFRSPGYPMWPGLILTGASESKISRVAFEKFSV